MECGWDSNTIAPWDQQEDFSIEHFQTPEQCQQLCLQRSACRAYRVDGVSNTYCEIFNVGLGVNASHVINPTRSGTQWWDRNCQQHVPAPCRTGGSGPSRTAAPPDSPVTPTNAPTPMLTTGTVLYSGSPTSATTGGSVPTVTPPAHLHLAKRDAPFPPYLEDLSYAWSSVYMIPACSCVISSAGEPQLVTTTMTATEWTSHTVSVLCFLNDFSSWLTGL